MLLSIDPINTGWREFIKKAFFANFAPLPTSPALCHEQFGLELTAERLGPNGAARDPPAMQGTSGQVAGRSAVILFYLFFLTSPAADEIQMQMENELSPSHFDIKY